MSDDIDSYIEKLQEMQEAVLHAIDLLMKLDPELDSPEGNLLKEMALAQSKYEDSYW